MRCDTTSMQQFNKYNYSFVYCLTHGAPLLAFINPEHARNNAICHAQHFFEPARSKGAFSSFLSLLTRGPLVN